VLAMATAREQASSAPPDSMPSATLSADVTVSAGAVSAPHDEGPPPTSTPQALPSSQMLLGSQEHNDSPDPVDHAIQMFLAKSHPTLVQAYKVWSSHSLKLPTALQDVWSAMISLFLGIEWNHDFGGQFVVCFASSPRATVV
jgi:hypothetical protein